MPGKRGRTKLISGKKWEIIWLDDNGEYHRANGYDIDGLEYIKFYFINSIIPIKVLARSYLQKASLWSKEERTANKLSVRLYK